MQHSILLYATITTYIFTILIMVFHFTIKLINWFILCIIAVYVLVRSDRHTILGTILSLMCRKMMNFIWSAIAYSRRYRH